MSLWRRALGEGLGTGLLVTVVVHTNPALPAMACAGLPPG